MAEAVRPARIRGPNPAAAADTHPPAKYLPPAPGRRGDPAGRRSVLQPPSTYATFQGEGFGIEPYSMSLHPAGFTHGPHPGAVDAALHAVQNGARFAQETAVMIDATRPLALGEAGLQSDQRCRATNPAI